MNARNARNRLENARVHLFAPCVHFGPETRSLEAICRNLEELGYD